MPSSDERTHDSPTRIIKVPDTLRHRRIPSLPVIRKGPSYPLDNDTAGSPYDLPPSAIIPTIEAASQHEDADSATFEAAATDTYDCLELDPDEDESWPAAAFRRISERWNAICAWGPLGTFGDWYESLPAIASWTILGLMLFSCLVLEVIIVWLSWGNPIPIACSISILAGALIWLAFFYAPVSS